ncbi:hypothetical protein NMY22_g5955 [Coprinellus aureogranulatus]|nr:hypothetical protein NMY22_g5955 [Coprinellus aureogranulatus]
MKSTFAALLSFLVLTVHVANATVYQSFDALPKNKQYDYIVVGGGIGGSVVANRLSENLFTSVLLIEAGPDDDGELELAIPGNYPANISKRFHWNFTTTPQPGLGGRSIDYDRGFVLGGSTSVNGMVYTRGAGEDYDRWAKVTGDIGWSWNLLWPYALKHERFSGAVGGRDIKGQYNPLVHGYSGYSKVALPWSPPTEFDNLCMATAKDPKSEFDFNLDLNSGKPLGLTWTQSLNGGGARSSASQAYLTPSIRKRPNLSIVVNTLVTRVLPVGRASNKDFRTVEIGTPGGPRKTLTAMQEVILSGGAISTPQILLNSGIGDSADLKPLGIPVVHELKDVGKNLQDHVSTVAFGTTTRPDPAPVDRDQALRQWNTNKTGPLTEAVGHTVLWHRLPKNSAAIKAHGDPSSGSNAPHIELFFLSNIPGQTFGGAAVLLTPKSHGTVKIASSNPFDKPLIDLAFLSHPFDIAALKEGVRAMKRFYSHPVWANYTTTPAAPIGPDPDSMPEADWVAFTQSVATSTMHAVGTCAMSKRGARDGVVDPNLKVKGVKGLRIVDGSVVPFVPTGHSMAAIYILSERAADLIKLHL